MPCRCSSHHHHLASADHQPWEGALPRLRSREQGTAGRQPQGSPQQQSLIGRQRVR